MRDLRQFVTTLVIASFAIAAAMGIFTLLSPGEFGETEARVLVTTLIVGAESILALCYLAVADTRWRWVSVAGGGVSLVASLLALWMLWTESDGEALWKSLGVAITLAVAGAQAALLLALADRPRTRRALGATLLTTATAAAMVIVAILADGDVSSGFWRTFGVVAILNVLGSIVLTALGLAHRRSAPPPGVPTGSISAGTMALVEAAARARGLSADALVRRALDNLPEAGDTAT